MKLNVKLNIAFATIIAICFTLIGCMSITYESIAKPTDPAQPVPVTEVVATDAMLVPVKANVSAPVDNTVAVNQAVEQALANPNIITAEEFIRNIEDPDLTDTNRYRAIPYDTERSAYLWVANTLNDPELRLLSDQFYGVVNSNPTAQFVYQDYQYSDPGMSAFVILTTSGSTYSKATVFLDSEGELMYFAFFPY